MLCTLPPDSVKSLHQLLHFIACYAIFIWIYRNWECLAYFLPASKAPLCIFVSFGCERGQGGVVLGMGKRVRPQNSRPCLPCRCLTGAFALATCYHLIHLHPNRWLWENVCAGTDVRTSESAYSRGSQTNGVTLICIGSHWMRWRLQSCLFLAL